MKILSKIYIKAYFDKTKLYYRFWCLEVKNAFLSLQAKDYSIKSLCLSLIVLCGKVLKSVENLE